MKISEVRLSVFELPALTRLFRVEDAGHPADLKWRQRPEPRGREHLHVMHVRTDEGVEGVCTVGDARYLRMRTEDLEQLRLLVVGEDPLARERLHRKLSVATRQAFAPAGWTGAFDNCLWDIAGKVAGLPVYRLMGAAREAAPAYYNFLGESFEAQIADAERAVSQGFFALKDHFGGDAATNIGSIETVRARFPDIALVHDAALATYSFEEAVKVGCALEAAGFEWFEEPFSDRRLSDLVRLCSALTIPVAGCETLMGERELCAEWLRAGALDILRGNARHGSTPVLKLAAMAELHNTTIELNGPGGLFGLVHAHLCCAIAPTTYYEFFPGGTRDLLGKEIGLTNPPMPQAGYIRPPEGPGWGAEWDRAYAEKARLAFL